MSLRDIERGSIRAFLEAQRSSRNPERSIFQGARVLDFGCGDQPYRELIEEWGGIYTGYDSMEFPAHVTSEKPKLTEDPYWEDQKYDVVVCTQVIQYLPEPLVLLNDLHDLTESDGVLLMTGPTNWPIVETSDLWRFTPNGVALLLHSASFVSTHVEARASVEFEGETWPLGWQAIARP